MTPRRVVLVLVEPPAPFGNAAARWYHVLLRGLVERGHRVVALASSTVPQHAADAARLFPAPEYDLRIFPTPPPGPRLRSFRQPHAYLFSEAMKQAFAGELARGVDVLHLEQTWAGWLAKGHEARSVINVHYLFALDLADAPFASPLDRLRRGGTAWAERALLRRFPSITTLSPRLTDQVRAIHPGAHVATVPLGIDSTRYPFGPPKADGPPTVALIGSFGWWPTLEAGRRLVSRLWPAIRRQVPEARLILVGRRVRAELGGLAVGPDIELFEDVAEATPFFQKADVLLYPTSRGSGMKVKVLEAFALGTPVVTTFAGVEGLPASDGVEAGIADDDAGLIARTVALLRDPDRRTRQRIAARALVESHCGPSATLDRVEAAHARVVAGGQGPGRAL